MRSVLLVAALTVTLAGCANADTPEGEYMAAPKASTQEETMKMDAQYVSTINKGTVRVIADNRSRSLPACPM